MADEMNDGAAYLRALKQATGAPSGAAAAPVREQDRLIDNFATVQASENFQGAEKRRRPRYKCEGSVQLREKGCDVRTWSTFTDISLNGCYVEAPANPAGTLLHMKLEAGGICVETKGKVRISYPYLGMGIAFEDMSEENAAHLKQLLASLSRPRVIMGPAVNSPHPTTGPMDTLPEITHPEAAVRSLIEFFEIHQILMRDDFVKLLKKSR